MADEWAHRLRRHAMRVKTHVKAGIVVPTDPGSKSVHMTLAQRGSSMIHRTLPHTRVSRSPRYAQAHLRGIFPGGAQADTGRAAACTVRLSAGPPYFVVVRGWSCPDGHCRGPLLLALQRRPYGTRLSPGHSGLGIRRPRAASSTPAHHGAAPNAAPVARSAAQGYSPGVWVVPYALELCHAGPDAAGRAERRGCGRDHAALASRERRRRGVSRDLAWNTGKSAPGPGRISRRPALAIALPGSSFDGLGLPRRHRG